MKKLLSLLLALAVCVSLAACGGGSSGSGGTPTDGGDTGVAADDGGTGVVTDDALKPLAEVYNKIAPLYNEAYDNAEANGWMEDEQTAAEIQALGATLGPIGAGLAGESDALESADVEGMAAQLEELIPSVEELVERVSVPYEG